MSFAGSGPPSDREPVRPPPVSRTVIILVSLGLVLAYLAYNQGRIGVNTLFLLAALVPSVILHEISHGVVAKWFGDFTARDAGRLTLNPLRHIDAFGTLILPVLLALTAGTPLGYAKPVPVDVTNMTKNQRLMTSMAGPATNVGLMLLTVLVIRFVAIPSGNSVLITALVSFGAINVVLAVFNSIPIPPLDGSSIIERFLPYRYLGAYLAFRKYSMFLLLAVFLFANQIFGAILRPFINAYLQLLT